VHISLNELGEIREPLYRQRQEEHQAAEIGEKERQGWVSAGSIQSGKGWMARTFDEKVRVCDRNSYHQALLEGMGAGEDSLRKKNLCVSFEEHRNDSGDNSSWSPIR
jgi:hypothetical protein